MSHFPIEKRKKSNGPIYPPSMTKQVSRERTLELLDCQDAVMFSIIVTSCSLQSLSSHLSRNEMINSISLTIRPIIWRGRDHYRLFWPKDKRWLISVCRINHANFTRSQWFYQVYILLDSCVMHSRWCRGLWWWPRGQMSVSPSPHVTSIVSPDTLAPWPSIAPGGLVTNKFNQTPEL